VILQQQIGSLAKNTNSSMKITLTKTQSIVLDAKWVYEYPDFDEDTAVLICGEYVMGLVRHETYPMRDDETLRQFRERTEKPYRGVVYYRNDCDRDSFVASHRATLEESKADVELNVRSQLERMLKDLKILQICED